jgi:acyl-CoA thioester hydrolase
MTDQSNPNSSQASNPAQAEAKRVSTSHANDADIPPTRKFLTAWSDMDMNGHMANTAYLNKAGEARVLILREMGFPREEFTRLRLGVVVMKDEIEYRREVGWMDEIVVTLLIAGLAPDASRFKFRHDVLAADGALCARITTTGGFMNLDERKLVTPPPGVLALYQTLPRTDDFAELPSSIKARS